METIAITVWNEIMSPLFDASCSLLIVHPDEHRELCDVRNMSIIEKADVLKRTGTSHLICGAISSEAYSTVSERDIIVISWISGIIEHILDSFKKNENVSELFAMPGCRSPLRTCNQRLQKVRCCKIK